MWCRPTGCVLSFGVTVAGREQELHLPFLVLSIAHQTGVHEQFLCLHHLQQADPGSYLEQYFLSQFAHNAFGLFCTVSAGSYTCQSTQ
jgi:hypothetical protein